MGEFVRMIHSRPVLEGFSESYFFRNTHVVIER